MTNFRRVYKSDHLAVSDVEELKEGGSDLIFTIREVKQEWGVVVAGKKGNFNIAYFVEDIKPWVLNAGNAKILRGWAGSIDVEKWVNLKVQLFINPNVKFGSEQTGGVRINPKQPKGKQTITPSSGEAWDRAVASFKNNGNLKAVLQHVDISREHQELILEQANVS